GAGATRSAEQGVRTAVRLLVTSADDDRPAGARTAVAASCWTERRRGRGGAAARTGRTRRPGWLGRASGRRTPSRRGDRLGGPTRAGTATRRSRVGPRALWPHRLSTAAAARGVVGRGG